MTNLVAEFQLLEAEMYRDLDSVERHGYGWGGLDLHEVAPPGRDPIGAIRRLLGRTTKKDN